MATPSTRSVLWALALAGLLPSCTDDPAAPAGPGPGDVIAPAPAPITWRVPCGATVHRDDRIEATHRYAYDDHKRLVSDEARDALGRVTRLTTQGWVGDRLAWQDVRTATDGPPDGFYTALEYSSGGFLLRVTSTDREFGDGRGADGSQVVTYAYDATGARIASTSDYLTPGLPDSRSTITGDRTERVTEVSMGDEGDHTTRTWEQPDRDPEHWTVELTDYDSDDRLDVRRDRTLDAQGLPLTHVDLDFRADPAGIVVGRVVTAREPDGTPLTIVEEDRASDGELFATYRTEHHFVCE